MGILYSLCKFLSGISVLLLLSLNCPAGHDTDGLVRHFNQKAVPVETSDDIDELIRLAGNRKLVLLGESSHGTTEFYQWRAEITKRLIAEEGFSFVAVEGDWAAIYGLNEYVRGDPGTPSSARRVLRDFERWPQWMWANRDIEDLAEWMRDFNKERPYEKRVGFYGMDVYGQWDAMEELIKYVRRYMPEHSKEIEEYLQCFESYDRNEWIYARAVAESVHPSCKGGLERIVYLLNESSSSLKKADRKKYFRARQNAYVVKNAEDFYRLAVLDNTLSWNSRANHMWETVKRLYNYHGSDAKAVVWAHNTHVGDASATNMQFHNMVNIGLLSRREFGHEQVFITGFGTYTGSLNAGASWGADMEIMDIPEGVAGSYEEIFSRLDHDRFLIIFDDEDASHPILNQFRGHRAIGVVYDPSGDSGNYVPTILPRRYDAFIFIKNTGPLKPLR